jgi:ABC-type nitrate/sulfonate/bicarbonate transport system substrate-binding protein
LYALAGEVDAIFTADQPASVLISKAPDDWVIVARLMYNRVAIYVPTNSPIQSLADLKGKIIGLPIGAAAEKDAIKAMSDVGINLEDVDVRMANMANQSTIIKNSKPTTKKWGEYDAFAGFDPQPASFQSDSLVRMLHIGRIVSVVVMSKDFIKKHRNESVEFLEAFQEAWVYYANNQTQVNNWFIKDSDLDFGQKALDIAASLEPNIKAQNIEGLQIDFTQEDYESMTSTLLFLQQKDVVPVNFNINEHFDLSLIKQAKQNLVSDKHE